MKVHTYRRVDHSEHQANHFVVRDLELGEVRGRKSVRATLYVAYDMINSQVFISWGDTDVEWEIDNAAIVYIDGSFPYYDITERGKPVRDVVRALVNSAFLEVDAR